MRIVFRKKTVKGFLFTIILPVLILQVNTWHQPVITPITSKQTVLAEEELNISPMQASGYSTIIWSSLASSELNITLLDVAGHTVLSRQYPLRKGVNELLLTNLETLPAGLYFVKAVDGAQHRNGKLIVDHTL
ncbi:hypothetical protein A4D02_27260 [Niastella koreensis]|uniref:Secretion system C-terminal sorting domain-containing protein n=2 Tax=Niastella koreensis TaxID=354356 RepID=G8TGT9_NIAKG|nr:T9SS type A sorting domain-containing protein [Niastella koreensis]AEV99541.1 hypothetical protein Niako_3215 [Niastella koreensis GR20-10]OQP50135.1 hypothetical protein A4D02_27260 [Niastella koreensis]